MPESPTTRALSLWRRLTATGRVAAVSIPIYAVAAAVEAAGVSVPGMGIIRVYFAWALFYWTFFFLFGWVRRRLLWGLRNRLLVAYVFIAVVPIFLLLCMAGISAYILYGQLGSYVLSEEVHHTLDRMGSLAEAMTAFPEQSVAQGSDTSDLVGRVPVAAQLALGIPGLEIRPQEDADLLSETSATADHRFEGLVQQGDQLWMEAVAVRTRGSEQRVVMVSVMVTPELLDSFALDLGRIRWDLVRLERPGDRGQGKVLISVGSTESGKTYVPIRGISSQKRTLPPPAHWLDQEITGFSNFEAVSRDPVQRRAGKVPVIASFYARPSRLNHVLFASLGDLSGLPFILLVSVGGLFLVIEAGALVTGVVLTRTITRSVDDLYGGTQRVKAGDLAHRIRNVRNDQLGALAGSFNEMIVSVARAIEEQRQRERLENELSIAREVQNQLFPRTIPRVPGLHLVASCRAARMVSGDYYDFIAMGDTELAFIVADIAGKGIPAALLMASLQASLRSQVLDEKTISSTAAVITRLNRHLVTTTPEDRFATLFFGIYNAETRVLRYTNAGHLPPIYFSSAGVRSLDVGGTIVGMFRECEYEQGTVTLEPGSLLAVYTDGISEPENAYGEQFGRQRIIDVIQRNRAQRPEAILDAVVAAAEHWASTPEQADDMTVLLANVV
jgi:phosphoserine phosphatase RsbU/P